VSGMFGQEVNTDEMTNKLEKTKTIIEEVNKQFQNPVCIIIILVLCVN
jgi:hypothetical protein